MSRAAFARVGIVGRDGAEDLVQAARLGIEFFDIPFFAHRQRADVFDQQSAASWGRP